MGRNVQVYTLEDSVHVLLFHHVTESSELQWEGIFAEVKGVTGSFIISVEDTKD
eukprot:CAMPEP_0176448432 /NCGR_PEP_ID=MMETSP0127-20121128/25773_1 /TAXON_ID=938130 /ORGANISM="Platyophrya macrostoma, Strain WH" /LENGTH=53 /DNA_ID=CAMNT_0017835367 /DNA_START=208 /DNA_END=366 /DNA_ORIENTATION=-